MSDLFHAEIPDEFIARVFAVMALTPQHTFQVLTKRHGRLRSLLSNTGFSAMVLNAAHELGNETKDVSLVGPSSSVQARPQPVPGLGHPVNPVPPLALVLVPLSSTAFIAMPLGS